MDAGYGITSSSRKFQYVQDRHFFCVKSCCKGLDRFKPHRSAKDFDYAHYMLTEGRKQKEKPAAGSSSPSTEAFRKQLKLSFKNKPPASVKAIPDFDAVLKAKHVKPRRSIRLTPPDRTVDAQNLADNYFLNLLDWGTRNILAIAIGNTVYLWDVGKEIVSELVTTEDKNCPVTSIKWAPDGERIAVGLHNSDVQIWDSISSRQMTTLRRGHQSRVGVLDWNNHMLTSGGMDGQIVNNDIRIGDHIVDTYRGHRGEVCGLKWSLSGQQLASGGNDNLLHIWDRSTASSNSPTQYLHRLEGHTAAVKALAWCPFQGSILASGGGDNDQSIKFWNTHTGACLNTIDTGSQVSALLWNKNERELLSSHGFTQNQLTLWKYLSMVKIAELTGHRSRVLFMTQSPDGCTVATAAGDESLMFWNVFGTPKRVNKSFGPISRLKVFVEGGSHRGSGIHVGSSIGQ